MKSRHQIIAVLALAAVALAATPAFAQPNPAPAAASEESIRKAVLDTNARMSAAANRMDVDAFFSFILDTDKGTIIQNGTLFKTRQEAMDAVRKGFMGVAKVNRQFTNPQVTVVSPEIALLASEGTVSATLTDGRIVDARFAVSLVFVRKEGEWKLLHGHYSMPVRM